MADNRKDIEPEVQILAQATGGDLFLDRAGRGGDHAHIDAARAGIAQTRHLALLQRAQKLALRLDRQFFDIIQEQGAAMGQFQLAGLVAQRTLIGTTDLAEKLGLHRAGGDRAAAHMDQGAAAAGAGIMDGVCDFGLTASAINALLTFNWEHGPERMWLLLIAHPTKPSSYRFEESPYIDGVTVGDLTGYSLGIGYNFGNTKLDVTYDQASRTNETPLYNVGLTDAAIIDRVNSNVTLSLSFNI